MVVGEGIAVGGQSDCDNGGFSAEMQFRSRSTHSDRGPTTVDLPRDFHQLSIPCTPPYLVRMRLPNVKDGNRHME